MALADVSVLVLSSIDSVINCSRVKYMDNKARLRSLYNENIVAFVTECQA